MHYKDVEDYFIKMFNAYQEEHRTKETQSSKHVSFQTFELSMKQTYLDYKDDVI